MKIEIEIEKNGACENRKMQYKNKIKSINVMTNEFQDTKR